MLPTARETRKAIGASAANSRPTGDFYATPPVAVAGLLSKERFNGEILEPCCGNGAISRALLDAGYSVISRDLHDWGYGDTGIDFLTAPPLDCGAVVTNPPFKLASEFVLRSLECVRKSQGKVAILNRIAWLESAKRKRLFESTPLASVWIFSKRIPRLNRFDFTGTPSTSLLGFAWYVWDWKTSGRPNLGWI